jgi:hypothetical protein
MEAQNAFAGQGAVLLDIGGDVGALIVAMPVELDGVEIEIRPVGAAAGAVHEHVHEHEHDHAHVHPHVAVVARPTASGPLPSIVFPELLEGDYELYERLDGRVRLLVSVRGGEVAEARWPTAG